MCCYTYDEKDSIQIQNSRMLHYLPHETIVIDSLFISQLYDKSSKRCHKHYHFWNFEWCKYNNFLNELKRSQADKFYKICKLCYAHVHIGENLTTHLQRDHNIANPIKFIDMLFKPYLTEPL